MAGRAPRRFPVMQRAIVAAPPSVERDLRDVDRAVAELAATVNRLIDEPSPYLDVDLVVGTNRLSHGLGRRPVEVRVMPFTADNTFAWGYDPRQTTNPQPDKIALLSVAGTAMRARVFFA